MEVVSTTLSDILVKLVIQPAPNLGQAVQTYLVDRLARLLKRIECKRSIPTDLIFQYTITS